MQLCLAPQEHLSPLEALLTIYAPILECLVSHLPTAAKLSLAQTSNSLRQLLHSYPPFFSHLDFRLQVYESAGFDTYPPGTVYNLDRLLQLLPVEGRITSLTLDWTAVSGYFLFNKILDRCQHSLEHLSVRGCRKVSIKHHIVPHFVYQTSILPLHPPDSNYQKPVLKSLYVYKARGVRRKPFIIDRKPADGDEPSRYLTTLCEDLGIWLDLGLCPTPRLRCPRRRDILRRNKEKFCVPFDKRWRIQGGRNESLSQVDQIARQQREQTEGEGITCWSCEELIPDRCEACVHQMTCSACSKPLCHQCAFLSNSSAQPAQPQTITTATQVFFANAQPQTTVTTATQVLFGAADTADPNVDVSTDSTELEVSAIPSPLLRPCCTTAPGNHADNLCAPCHASIRREACSLCDKRICIKHEYDRCRKCQGGCDRLFCFTTPDYRESGCSERDSGKAGLKDCLSCTKEVCGDCRSSYANPTISSPSPVPSEDDGSESTLSVEDDNGPGGGGAQPGGEKTSCNCRVCQENYYCPECWPRKPMPCESRPRSILQEKRVLDDSVALLQVEFEDSSEPTKWFTHAAFHKRHPDLAGPLISEFEARQRMSELNLSSLPNPPISDDNISDEVRYYNQVEVADDEWILERVLVVNSNVLCKWLGRDMGNTWESRSQFPEGSREDGLVEAFIQMHKAEFGVGADDLLDGEGDDKQSVLL
ncbi:hypothetical protein EDC01DRAFT_644960 [Geopyxis carbonaria]|nr:hypothetical protein EDC01DRAFT_644960 [Geopyxis carbonaria]